MSIIKITDENFERYLLQANPKRFYASSSVNLSHVHAPGITGSVLLFADGTNRFKDVYAASSLNTSASSDQQIEDIRSVAIKNSSDSNFLGSVSEYMNFANAQVTTTKFDKTQKITRVVPGFTFDKTFQKKTVLKSILMPFYRHKYPTLQYNYTNYNSLNFVTCSYLPTGTAIIYPAMSGVISTPNVNCYAPSDKFTFEFYINPRYTEENVGDHFHAGTILHMSSSYAISLLSGSSVGIDGKTDSYRLLLQLSQSAEIPPNQILVQNGVPSAPSVGIDPGFLFCSTDVLKRNNWHHVSIRWDSQVQNGTGSFVVDNTEVSTFVISSASVMQSVTNDVTRHDADALFIGNFYEGSNSLTDPISGFFNPTASQRFGTISNNNVDHDPTDALLRHPLNAEIHDLKIFNCYKNNNQIFTSSIGGTSYDSNYSRQNVTGTQMLLSGTSANDNLIFYVPPFFTKESPLRHVNQTPFMYVTGTTDDPFNVAMSFGVGGHEINLQNFTREFVRGIYPRLYGLEEVSLDTAQSDAQTCNAYIYASGSSVKRNLTILPCDNGNFYPNYNVLLSGTVTQNNSGTNYSKFLNDFGALDLSIIDLKEMISTGTLFKNDGNDSQLIGQNSFLSPVMGSTPEDPGVGSGQILTILQRTKDPSSNQIVIFDVSNIFYGDSIKPKSVEIKDLSLSGSNGRIKITLKDDGYGNLYRSDALTTTANWASVGNVIYEEGLVLIKSPHLTFFGSDCWEMTFEGQRNIHVLEINVPAEKGIINSSSNSTYRDLIPSDYPSENANSFVYLTSLNLHDENLNVIGRANFAQPIVKRDSDKYTVRLRMDW